MQRARGRYAPRTLACTMPMLTWSAAARARTRCTAPAVQHLLRLARRARRVCSPAACTNKRDAFYAAHALNQVSTKMRPSEFLRCYLFLLTY
jgi:predicted deacetylase